ncbi:hypothetical protein [Dyella mobilis]|uniref:ABC transporter permease n=1 Tax=Dyella mobilis TaxID=1849582 RepID=A0ABS2KKN7_9GAMM|nr:hypothetical protein [Dyella mobilis]MBM7131485.1 hypothetical protein [Dyella mobilis]
MFCALLAPGRSWWPVLPYEMSRLPLHFVSAGAAVLLLGQAATLASALRASRVPPVEATRSV